MATRSTTANSRLEARSKFVSTPTPPPRAVLGPNPRSRILSQASPGDGRARRAGGKRAITVAGDVRGPPVLRGADATDPVLLEMQKGLLLNVGNVLDEFEDLDRDVRAFCDRCADYIAKMKQLPRITAVSPTVPAGSPVSKPPADFPGVEDYVYFTLLSIINSRLYGDIFRPFHPAISVEENKRYEEQYERRIDTSLQVASAEWRAKTFSTIDSSVTTEVISNVLERSTSMITNELLLALDALPGNLVLSKSFARDLRSLLRKAYAWNHIIKVDILKYDFEVFIVEPSSSWDPVQMEPFERLRTPVRATSRVVSTVSLGLIGSVSLDGARASHVQRKAKVMVEEWFSSNLRGRLASVVPPTYPPTAMSRAAPPTMSPGPSIPRTQPPPPSGPITQQPGRTPQMSRDAVSRGPPVQQPPQKKSGGCC